MRRFIVVVALLALSGCRDKDGPLTFDEPPVPGQRLHVVVDLPDRMFIEHPPVLVAGGDERFVYRDELVVRLGGRRVREVFVFHGIDTGDVAEVDTELIIGGVPVFLRSDHGLSNFDAWVSKDVGVSGERLLARILCRVTGVNTRLNRLAARPHYGIWITFDVGNSQ